MSRCQMITDRSESQGIGRKGSNRWRDGLYPFQTVVEKKRQRKGKGKGRRKKPQGASKRANLRIVDVVTREDSRDVLPCRLNSYIYLY